MNDDVALDYSGKRYQATIPDTLDLAERAELAINGLGGTIDPNLDYLPFGIIHWTDRHPHMQHWASADITCNPKYGQAFPMMRLASGSRRCLDEEQGNRTRMLARVQDGLYWDLHDPARPWRNVYGDSEGRYGKGKEEDFCVVGAAGLMLRAVLTWRELSDDPRLDP